MVKGSTESNPGKENNMDTIHIVMTSSARMPSSCWGQYANVAVVEVEVKDGIPARPKMISDRARGVVRIAHHFGPQNVGKTSRCAFRVAMKEAEEMAVDMNENGGY
tara:strand:+ start:77 stop:394 length:318 start_codon:yes stop_codon:yes gene_type:complete